MNLATKHETIPNPKFTKLIIRHLLSHNPNLNKCLDSPPHLVSDEACLEKLKYVVMGEPRHTSTLGTSIHEHGLGKGLMRRGDVPTPKKKKDVIPRRQRRIIFADNVFPDLDEALEQVNKEVDEGYQHLKVKLKAKDQPSPEAHLFLNLKRQGKESKEQSILEEIMKKAQGKGSGATADHSSSSNDSSESPDDAKTGSERDS
ncbi:hypothetical protein Tco_0049945, partial [Tanacetum coccineum]